MLFGLYTFSFLSILGICATVFGIVLTLWARSRLYKANQLFAQAKTEWKDARKDIENERRSATLKLKDEIHKRRSEFELEMKRERLELERFQNKINSRSEIIEKKENRLDELSHELQQKERELLRATDVARANENKILLV